MGKYIAKSLPTSLSSLRPMNEHRRDSQPPIRNRCSHWRGSPQARGNPKGREASLDLLAGLPGSFARPPVFPAGLITVFFRKLSLPGPPDPYYAGASNGPSYNSCTMRRVLKTANKPLEIKPQEKSVWICMCGLSKNQPYCDGSHKKVADEEDGKTYEYDSEGHRREVTM